ncbi:MAG: CHASE2 domain-containing protein [Actinomycetota bacterium]
MRRTARYRFATAVLIAFGLTAFSWGGLTGGIFQGTQLRLADTLFPAIDPHPGIVVLGIDDTSLARLGRWPFDRRVHAQIIERLAEEEAALVGYDVQFSEPSRDPQQDAALVQAMEEARVVLVGAAEFRGTPGERTILRAGAIVPPIPVLEAAATGFGHANVIPDPDGVVRSLPAIIETPNGDLLPSFSLALLGLAERLEGAVTLREDALVVGTRLIETGGAQFLDINFTEGFAEFSAADLIDGKTPPGAFAGKIVLVGATALGLGDVRFTPLNKSGGEPGVFVHANALNTMLRGAYVTHDGAPGTLVSVFLLGLLVALTVAFTRIWFSPIAALGLLVLFVFVAFRRFDGGFVMNLVYPAIAVILSYLAALAVRYFTEVRERRFVQSVFSRYLASDVVNEVLASPEGAMATLAGAARPMTMLFADLRGFTSASENADPQDVVTALNGYLDAMTRAVIDERGTVDKFMGDCVMAFWGAPKAEPDHAKLAVRAGMAMLDYIDEAVKEGRVAGLNVRGCGVGIATGDAVVGNIGSSQRLDYTVIGDTVNTASRLCDVSGPGEIMVTEACAATLDDSFRLAEMPPLQVKGKAEDLRVFQILREGQEARTFEEGAETGGKKGAFQARRAAGYAPVEPIPEVEDEPG